MNQQLTLQELSLSVFIGQPPTQEGFKTLKNAYVNTSFRQVVFIDSQNLVQMCNFVRRCRQEKRQGKKFKYLVFLHFIPHREAWHLLNVFKDLNMTLIVYGGVCTNANIQELFDYNPMYLLQWHNRSKINSIPIIFGANLLTQTCGVIRTHGEITTLNATEDDIPNRLSYWASTVRFDSYSYNTMDGFRTTNNDKSSSQSSQQQHQQRSHSHATSTMNVSLACSILHITEPQSHNTDTIKKAFRKLAREYHPDKNRDEAAHKTFTQLNEAKTFLESLF